MQSKASPWGARPVSKLLEEGRGRVHIALPDTPLMRALRVSDVGAPADLRLVDVLPFRCSGIWSELLSKSGVFIFF